MVIEDLRFNGFFYATKALADGARREAEAGQKRADAANAARAAAFERDLQDRYLSTGASPALWEKEKNEVLREARRQAALTGEDGARVTNAARYG